MQRQLWAAVLAAVIAAGGAPCVLAQQEITVVLLGTGSPRPDLDRFGPSILVAAGPERLVFDVGRGATQRLSQLGIPFDTVTGVFLTHLHSDHVVGLPDLWLTGWIISQRAAPLVVRGPEGTVAMAEHLMGAFQFDVGVRISDGGQAPDGGRLDAADIREGIVLERNGVRVTAFEVDHSPVRPALGYRIDYGGRSVVLSGDTRPSANLIAHARGADLLVHEVAAASAADLQAVGRPRTVVAHHTTPEQAGDVFSAVAPKLAVYSHIVLFSGLTADSLVALTRTRYAGPLVVGTDLMTFHVGDDVGIEGPPTR